MPLGAKEKKNPLKEQGNSLKEINAPPTFFLAN